MITADQLVAHAVGDYGLQSDWKQGERPTPEPAVGQRWRWALSGSEFTVVAVGCPGRFAVLYDGEKAPRSNCAVRGNDYLGPPSPVSGSVPRPAKGQRWRWAAEVDKLMSFQMCLAKWFTLGERHASGRVWKIEACSAGCDDHTWFGDDFFADGRLEYVDTPSTPIAPRLRSALEAIRDQRDWTAPDGARMRHLLILAAKAGRWWRER